MKRALSIIFAIAATLTLFLTVLYNPNASKLIVSETIANSREIQQSLYKAAEFTDTFHHENGRLPNEAEFSNWTKLQADNDHSQREMFIETNLDNPIEALLQDFGPPNEGSYIIGLWRGEWNEYYISWKRDTTLEFDPKNYYLLGSAIRDFIFLIFLFLIFAATSIWLWLSSKKGLKAIHNE